MIRETVPLLFDPKNESEEIQTVFADDLARTIWLAVKDGHVAGQYFNRNCLYYARVIADLKKTKQLTAEQLMRILSGWAMSPVDGIMGDHDLAFATELLPFINGEKTIKFEIRTEQPTKEEGQEMAMLHAHPGNTSQTVCGEQLRAGALIQPNDVYASATGKWEKAPCPGIVLNEGSQVYWVRPEA